MSLIISKIILLILSALALYRLWMVPYQNGLITQLVDLQKAGAFLPGSESVLIRQHYTGVKVIDNQIVSMVGFFWPALDGSRPDISLVCLELLMQGMAAWVLVGMESLRVGNKARWYLTSVTIAGIVMHNLGFGVITPLWMYLHLASSSATIDPSTPGPLTCPNPLRLLTLPISTLLAMFLPNVLMALPVPHRLSSDVSTKQFYVALWQLWPVFLATFQLIFQIAISAVVPRVNILSEHDKRVKSLRYLRRCYAFALILTTTSHLVAVGVPLLAHLFPSLFSPAHLPQLRPANILVPSSPFTPVEHIPAMADAVLPFLQWDLLTGSLAVLVWAVTLRVQAQARDFGAYECMEGSIKVAALVGVSGPVGAAAAILWKRDELVFGREIVSGSERKNE